MRNLFFALIAAALLPLSARAQTVRVSLPQTPISVQAAFDAVSEQAGLSVAYNESVVDVKRYISVNVRNMTVSEAMTAILKGTGNSFKIDGRRIIVTAAAQAKKVTVTGKVTDAAGAPLPGASVVVKGTTVGTVSDDEGRYSIAVSGDDAVLTFSFVGYATEEVPVGAQTAIDVTLSDDAAAIDEVVVVGYGVRSREKLISSVSTISNEELEKSTVPNLENALAGRVSGVFSRQSTGEPGSDAANLQIRGFGSALTVVDGIPGRGFSNLDPNEIESISVLKDAAAAAVYGMQGANGVILVTTKRGEKRKKTNVDVSTRFGLQQPHNYPETASAALWHTLVNEYNANMQLINDPNAVISDNSMQVPVDPYQTDWYDEMIKAAPISQSNINLSGGTEKIAYFISGGFLWQDGIWTTNSTSKKRVNLRSNLDVDIIDNLSLSVGIGAYLNNLHYPGRSAAEIARSLKYAAPNIPVRWEDYPDYYAYGGEDTDNPKALADETVSGYSKSMAKNMTVDVSLKYKVPFLEGLSLKATFGYTGNDSWSKQWNKNIVYMGYRAASDEYYQSVSAANTNKASLTLNDGTDWSWTGQGFINYLNTFQDHTINSSVIFELSQSQVRSTSTSRGEFPSTVLDMMAGGLSNKQVSNSESLRAYRAASIIGRFSYDYQSKYFVDFNFRYDGAQYFADKWGFFPSASVGWMLTREDFMSFIKPVVDEFKLRASWGELGDLSAAKSYYRDNELYYFQSGYRYPGAAMNFGDRTIYGLTQTVNPNMDFTWSKSTLFNAGFDFKMWKGLLSGSAEIFYRTRTGLPAQKANDNAGALATYYNLNEDNTRGFEVTLTHANKIGDFSYTVSGNISWSRTQNGPLEHGQYTSGYDQWKWYNGNRWTNIRWGLNQIGQYQSYEEIANAPMHNNSNNNSVILPGDLKYEDWNGDGYIDDYDMRPIGRTAYPELMYGINVGFQWKGLDFSMFWQGGALSNFTVTAFDRDPFREGKTYWNTWQYFEDRWHKADYSDPNSAWIPGHFPAGRDMFAATINHLDSDYWMWNGNYIRLKNVELGYTLPEKWTKKIKQLRFYISMYNVLTFSAQKYFDPEQAESILSFAAYPQIKSFNAGVNIKF